MIAANTQPMIDVKGISKMYRLGEYTSDQLREVLTGTVKKVARKILGRKSNNAKEDQTLWALRDVNFKVNQGEVVGVIGHNGAGKSTLLKVLSRITDPTQGKATIRGRVGSLLEVGTGFHPELTGRENIFLNGAILGMTRAEIRKQFDSIVDFAEVERFLDTPVKRYSSGMYVRLAFAVAAHLEPEVLIVDEVLAVGDIAFQSKCLTKMSEVSQHGRTILFVSHNMGAIETLCTRAVVLDHGTITFDGSTKEGVQKYLKDIEQRVEEGLENRTDRKGNGRVRITRLEAHAGMRDAPMSSPLMTGSPATIQLTVDKPLPNMLCILKILDNQGLPIVDLRSRPWTEDDLIDPSADDKITCEINELLLVPGRYRIDIDLVHTSGREWYDVIEGAAFINVSPGKVGVRAVDGPIRSAKVTLPHQWRFPSGN